MTTAQRDTLKAALKGELRRQEGEDPPAHPNTLGSLVRRGLLERSQRFSRHETRMDVWTITDAGRDALKAPERVAEERPTFMAHGAIRYRVGPDNRWVVVKEDEDGSYVDGDYTQDPRRRFDHLEVAGQASYTWRRKADDQRVAAQDARKQAKRLSRSLRAA